MSPSSGIRPAQVVLLLAGLAGTLLAVDAACYWRYMRAAASPPPADNVFHSIRHVPERTALRLGWILPGKDSSFVQHELEKPAGVVRVGCLGDSFTYGDEVGPAQDYPSILQRLFRERGFPQVEVINFGMGWYGFQQTFIMWDEVARRFGLDYVLLGPRGFFLNRDVTFDHSFPSSTYLIHARHVLDGDGLRLVDVAGDTFAARAAAYRRFVPYWRYLRYDRRAPAFLACLLPEGRELRNPFYYRRDAQAEIDEIYRRLLSRMADSGAQIVLGLRDRRLVDLGRGLGRANLYGTRIEEVWAPPYAAPSGHFSPAGNRLIAEQYFAILTGESRARLPRIAIKRLRRPASIPADGAPRSLEAFSRARLRAGGGRPWRFVEVIKESTARELPEDFLRRRGVRALLALKVPGQPLSEAAFYPLATELRDGMPLTVRSRRGELALGPVRLLRPDLQVGVADLGAVLGPANSGFYGINAIYTATPRVWRLLPGTIQLSGRTLFSMSFGRPRGRVALHPIRGRFLRIYPPAELLGSEPGPGAGVLRLALGASGREDREVPLSAWQRDPQDLGIDFDPPGLLRPIRRPGR